MNKERNPVSTLTWQAETASSGIPGRALGRVRSNNFLVDDYAMAPYNGPGEEPGAAELVEGSATLPGLAPGETATVELEVKLLGNETSLPALKLDVMEVEHRIFVSSKVDLVHGTAGWMDPPTVRFTQALVPDGEGDYSVVAEIDDDDGIARAWASVDGDKVTYNDTSSLRPTKHKLTLP